MTNIMNRRNMNQVQILVIEHNFKDVLVGIKNHGILINTLKQWDIGKTDFRSSKTKLKGVFQGMRKRFPDFTENIQRVHDGITAYMTQSSEETLNEIVNELAEILSGIEAANRALEPEEEIVEEAKEEVEVLLSYKIRKNESADASDLGAFYYKVELSDGRIFSSVTEPKEITGEDGRVREIEITVSLQDKTKPLISLHKS